MFYKAGKKIVPADLSEKESSKQEYCE